LIKSTNVKLGVFFKKSPILAINFQYHFLIIKFYIVLQKHKVSIMDRGDIKKKTTKRPTRNLIIVIIILAILVGIPFIFLNYQASKNGTTPGNILNWIMNRTSSTDSLSTRQSGKSVAGEKIDFLDARPVGQTYTDPPMISNLAVADLDNDGLLDIVVCDAKNNFVSWIRQYPEGIHNETILASDIMAPAHAQIMDFDKDGDKDIMVAVLGIIFPSNDKIGSVIVLENDGKCNFSKHLVAEKIARVSDVRAGDIDGDGDLDLAVAQFGYDDGETRWIENLGGWKFKSHILQNLSGPINVELVDMDNDSDLDIVSLVSQEWEQIFCYINDGHGNFQIKLLWGSDNEDFGSSGIYIYDFNKDGKQDILYTNGDAFDYIPPRGRPWHGVQWLENNGNYNFSFHRICDFIGAYSVRPADIDNDGDPDLFAVSGFNLWDDLKSQSFIWIENVDYKKFIVHDISNKPTHLITLETGDFNNDGLTDFVTGGMHAYKPFDRMGRITLWMNNGKLNKGNK
jgi:hypothetical protein